MNIEEYYAIIRKEPDFILWKEEKYFCLIIRNLELLNLCGYVGVTTNSKLYKKDYHEEELLNIDIHGGLTFSGLHDSYSVEGYPSDIWWIGFDCAHCYDITKSYIEYEYVEDAEYRDIKYVKNQIRILLGAIKEYDNRL